MQPLPQPAPETITCTHCGARLLLPLKADAATLTCPRCLNVVPARGAETASASAPGVTAVASSVVSAAPTSIAEGPPVAIPVLRCSTCGGELRTEWRFCPLCNTPTQSEMPPQAGIALEKEIRRDAGATAAFMVPLLVILVFGIFSLAFPPLLIVGLVVGVVLFISNNVPRRYAGPVLVGGTFSCLNVILLLILFSVLSTLAPFIILAAVCSSLNKR